MPRVRSSGRSPPSWTICKLYLRWASLRLGSPKRKYIHTYIVLFSVQMLLQTSVFERCCVVNLGLLNVINLFQDQGTVMSRCLRLTLPTLFSVLINCLVFQSAHTSSNCPLFVLSRVDVGPTFIKSSCFLRSSGDLNLSSIPPIRKHLLYSAK